MVPKKSPDAGTIGDLAGLLRLAPEVSVAMGAMVF
jgi:hypothetical protein